MMKQKKHSFALAVLTILLLAVIDVPFTGSMSRPFSSTLRITTAHAQSADAASSSAASLTYVAGSSVKLEQVIGDCDWGVEAASGACQPTTSQTVTRFNILGNGQGYSFEDDGKMIFLFGDTISKDVNSVNYHAADPLAWSTSTDPEAGLLLNFYTDSDGSPLFVKPQFPDGSKLSMGPFDVPNCGISLPDGVYIVCNSGSDASLPDPQINDHSVLVRFDEANHTFAAGRTISQDSAGGHFINGTLHTSGGDVLMYGIGAYRASDIYLSKTPESAFWAGTGTLYFAGLSNGQPTWTASENGAAPVVQDNPLNGPAWPNDSPTVGNLSVAYSSDVGLWLMTYDGGRQTEKTRGVYFTYAQQPWGPWAAPQLIYNDVREKGFGVFIHNPNILPDPPGDGLNGPTIGSNDPFKTPGGDFAPLMIERFTRVVGDTLKIYYTMSTWNPYTVVKMRSEFKITLPPDFSLGVDPSTIAASAPSKAPMTVNINRTVGFTGNVTVFPPTPLPDGVKLPVDPISTTGDSVSLKIKIKGKAQPGAYPLIFVGKDDAGRERDATITLVIR